MFAEDHRNLNTTIRPRRAGGWDLDGVWVDDFHNQIRRLLAGGDEGCYRDYSGTTADLATTLNQGWFYTGQHSTHLDAPRGTDPTGITLPHFVMYLQNHDVIGNRALFGERLHHLIDPAAFRAASALLLCVAETPLLFMGQEWAATSPFLYFTDHDEELGRLVAEGRREEFQHYMECEAPRTHKIPPDPQAASTFEASKLDWSERDREPHASTLRLYHALLSLRRSEPALRTGAASVAIALDEDTLALRRDHPQGDTFLIIARLRGTGEVSLHARPELLQDTGDAWEMVLTTEDPAFVPVPARPQAVLTGPVPSFRFARPAAVLLKAAPREEARHRGLDAPHETDR